MRRFSSYNLFIGGLASVLPTAQDLENKFTIEAGNITDYKIIGNDIACRVTADYIIRRDAFRDYEALTYYKDLERCTNIGDLAFFSIASSNVNEIKFLEATGVSQNCFYTSQISWDDLILPKVNSFHTSCFRAMKANSGTLNLPGVVKLTPVDYYSCFRTSGTELTVNMPNCTILEAINMFHEYGGEFRAYNCTSLGDAATVLGVFSGILSTFRLYINVALKTVNAGFPDADIQRATDNGATVFYTDNQGNIII